MEVLDLYKNRKHSVLKLGDKQFKIPAEYTVEEAERLLELEVKHQEVADEILAESEDERVKQIQKFNKIAFARLEILLQHFQPEITSDEIRTLVTHTEALEILGWFDGFKKRETELKKKLN